MPDDHHDPTQSKVSRRDFLKIGGAAAALPLVAPATLEAAGEQVRVFGPDPVSIVLTINGQKKSLEVEPRVTLLDALRNRLDLTGAKRVCDRGTCGACTVLLDGKPVYACSVLAIDAQGRNITTVESLGAPEKLHPVQQAFIDHDASQCGFCTPGFVMSATAVLSKYPQPTAQQVERGLAGNFCRCGTYKGLKAAVAAAGGRGAKAASPRKGA